jgi:hypothetical protein
MKRLLVSFILSFLLIQYSVYSQGLLTVSTDTSNYAYGQPIIIQVSILNNTDSLFTLEASSSHQAQFILNDFYSGKDTPIIPDEIYFDFNPGDKRTWIWILDPYKYGFPNIDGTQRLIGYYPKTCMRDTITFEAPIFYGGQVDVKIANEIPDSCLMGLKDSLKVTVLQVQQFNTLRFEKWQIIGFLIDSVISNYSNDYRFSMSLDRNIRFDSNATEIKTRITTPEYYFVSEAYPNPFNPITRIDICLKKSEKINIQVYNISGQRISNIFNGILPAYYRQNFIFDGSNFPSGLYIIQVKSREFTVNNKVVLLK